jgi:threonine/homoserine/homoserine lactone efflux protein
MGQTGTYLILGATYAFAAAVQPGQFQAYLISQTLANGWRRTVPAALSPILSDVPIICVVLLILTQVPPLLVHLLQVGGGVFLLYLARGAIQRCRHYPQTFTTPTSPAHQTVLKAALVNLLNPNPYLAWALVLGPLLLKAWREAPANGIALVAAFYLTMVIATAAIVTLFAAARSLGRRVARVLIGLSAVALGCFGVYQLWSGATALIQRGGLPW